MRHYQIRSLILAVAVLGVSAPRQSSNANAAVVINIQQVGSDVVATGVGSINLAALTSNGFNLPQAFVQANQATIQTGGYSGGPIVQYQGATLAGPSSWGSGAFTSATSHTGTLLGIQDISAVNLLVPSGYASGTVDSGTDTWTGTTIGNLGITPGSYAYSWGSGSTADSFTVNVASSAVPEPASLSLLRLGGLTLLRRRRRAVSI